MIHLNAARAAIAHALKVTTALSVLVCGAAFAENAVDAAKTAVHPAQEKISQEQMDKNAVPTPKDAKEKAAQIGIGSVPEKIDSKTKLEGKTKETKRLTGLPTNSINSPTAKPTHAHPV